jgi:hypothetical protein
MPARRSCEEDHDSNRRFPDHPVGAQVVSLHPRLRRRQPADYADALKRLDDLGRRELLMMPIPNTMS